ncbi:MAG: MCE family protein [Mycobacteriaceae bacterium]|nr:MCE family protein [Mycobacteriaceae bacterium]
MTKTVRVQLLVFVAVALLGVAYVGAKYVRLDTLLGIGEYKVTLDLPHTGGIFRNAEVTYRGVPVGRVDDLDLTAQGVRVTLVLNSGGPKIPASARAVVANRSAIGEQYLDLQPDSGDGPYLKEGSAIRGAVTTPLPVNDLVKSINTFAASVPLDDLRTTVTELGKAFNGQGDNLQVVVASLNSFTDAWNAALPQTLKLIKDGRVVLNTQAAQAQSIEQFASGLDQVSAQLRASDSDIRRLIGTGKQGSDQIDKLLDESGPALTADLTNLRTALQAISPKAWAIKPLLQDLPGLSLGPSSTAPGDGTTHFGLVLELNNPPACTQGYEGTQRIIAEMKAKNPNFDDERDEFPFNANAKCTVPQGSVTDVRGGSRAELADPKIAQPWDNKPKTMPDTLNLQPLASQMAALIGVHPK